MNTLRGIFPEPKTVPKRNFIKENMLHIKQMQGIVQNENELTRSRSELLHTKFNQNITKSHSRDSTRKNTKDNKSIVNEKIKPIPNSVTNKIKLLNNVPSERPKFMINTDNEKQKSLNPTGDMKSYSKLTQKANRKVYPDLYLRTAIEKTNLSPSKAKNKEIGIQTENWVQPKNTISVSTKQKSPQKNKHVFRLLGAGDSPTHIEKFPTNDQNSSVNRLDSVRSYSPEKFVEQISPSKKEIKDGQASKKNAQNGTNDPCLPPPTYQKGVIPKYIQERKEELSKKVHSTDGDEKCPEGHIILPDSERKETLKALRKRYGDLIVELNKLPVRSDTLKIRNRKIDIENELKRLDEGIKVFTRPKVFVKTGI